MHSFTQELATRRNLMIRAEKPTRRSRSPATLVCLAVSPTQQPEPGRRA
jgi:hypothetical protein